MGQCDDFLNYSWWYSQQQVLTASDNLIEKLTSTVHTFFIVFVDFQPILDLCQQHLEPLLLSIKGHQQ